MCDLSDEERVLVEMACGAALAAVYSGIIRKLQDESKHAMQSPPWVDSYSTLKPRHSNFGRSASF